MKKISLKASVAAMSLSLALIPVGFAQTPGQQQKSAAVENTQPLPGAKIAAQTLVAGGALTTTGIVVAGVAIVAAAAFVASNQNSNDDDLLRFLASLQTTATATSTR